MCEPEDGGGEYDRAGGADGVEMCAGGAAACVAGSGANGVMCWGCATGTLPTDR
jgi:hypothetical protein